MKLFALIAEGWGMKVVELYARVRYAVRIEGISGREAARRFGIDPRTVAKMLSFSVPPGYRRSRPASRLSTPIEFSPKVPVENSPVGCHFVRFDRLFC